MRRLSRVRDKAKISVSDLLFHEPISDADLPVSASSSQATPMPAIHDNTLPDPFENRGLGSMPSMPSGETSGHLHLHTLIRLRAQRAALVSRIHNIHQCISESQHTHLQAKELLKEKQASVALRKQNLAKAWSGLGGSSATSNSAAHRSRVAAKSRWLAQPAADHIDLPLVYTDVYTHYEHQSDGSSSPAISASETTDYQLGATLTRTRLQFATLQADAAAITSELSAVRAALARQAFDLYYVSPPENITARASSSSRSRRMDLSASSSVAQRIGRLSERYIHGSFGLGHAQAPSSAPNVRSANRDMASAQLQSGNTTTTASIPSSSSWSVVSLALPLPSETRRYPRETVNGAVTYFANLLQLLITYLGIALPFSIEQHHGRLAIRPNPLWDGGGGSSAKTLYLSSSAYAYITATHSIVAPRPSKLNNLAESTLGLGASTLSTIESYIHLPSGAGLPWGLTSNSAAQNKPVSRSQGADADTQKGHKPDESSRTASSTSSGGSTDIKSKPGQAAKSFFSALVMLCYDVAYLATKQGVQLDLVAAAANPLYLLSKVMQQPELGRLAHANYIRSSSIQDLSLPYLDYEQLAQILEPSNAATDGYKHGASRIPKPDLGATGGSRQTSGKSGKSQKILEQSYVDVGKAAASVLHMQDPSSATHKVDLQSSPGRTSLPKNESGPEKTPARSSMRSEPISSLQKQRIDADKRGIPASGAHASPSLDFLRQRGRDASKAKGSNPASDAVGSKTQRKEVLPESSENAAAKVGPGAVIFNGVEVGVGNLSLNEEKRPATAQLRELGQNSRKASAEEGWDLI